MKKSPTGTEAKGQQTVLIVDDERALTRALQIKLASEGIVVDVAENGADALDKLSHGKFRVIVLDLVMPVMDGFEVLTQLHRSGKHGAILVATNLGQEEDQERALALGAKEYFVKANTPLAEIVRIIKKHL